MPMLNRYAKNSKVSEAKFRQILRLFCLDLSAIQMAEITNLNRNTINRYVNAIRQHIAGLCEQHSPFSGHVEVDESYFGARRKKGKRGRGAYGKTIVFGILQRNDKVYTEIVSNCSRAALQKVIRGKVSLTSVIYSDGWRGYNGLVDVGYAKHLRVDHNNDCFSNGKCHINGIEGFWGYAKSRLFKFRGLTPKLFYLHLKECEFRFNNRGINLYKLLLNSIKNNPLF
jgi:transposase-like protein|tara:strand:- start:150 stop:830 length:681 start_codon:yes stop_codon:yes gene_type:complete